MKNNAFSLAMACLARREHSAAELMQKLRLKDCTVEEVRAAIEECQRLGYQSDVRYVDAYCQMRIAQGDGPLKIHRFLSAKGISDDTIAARLEDEDWYDHIQCLWQQKFGMLHDAEFSLQDKAKQQRFLLNRGFPVGIITRLWQKIAGRERI